MTIKYEVKSNQSNGDVFTEYHEVFEFESFQQLIEYKKWCSRHLVDEAVAAIKGVIPGENPLKSDEPTKH